ncbi:MAG: hypothetical protein M1828_002133 [Chrysothrix sp. TS-e1954]|nr:MAG: hypothetical protein M1828_002133 [Chrysothrix sp. TS-e1954]
MERQRKRELRDLNVRAWNGDKDLISVSGSLESSLKKNTAFIKRLRTSINASSTATFLQEIRTLSLHKYLSEVISACYEGLTKLKLPADVSSGVEVFSALHQRFGPDEFTSYVGWLIGRGLSTPDKAQLKGLPQDVKEKEEKERLARQRVLLRVATELWLVGALRSLEDISRPEEAGKGKENHKTLTQQKSISNGTSTDAEPFPLEVLKDMLGQDGQHANLQIVVQLVKAFSLDLLGRQEGDTESVSDAELSLVDRSIQQRFTNVLTRYFEGAKLHLVRDQATLNTQSRRNAEAYVRSGEIFEDRQANYERMAKAHEKFAANVQIMADCLGLDMPDLKNTNSTGPATDGSIGIVKAGEYLRGDGEGAGIWEDEDERRFYENLIDLKDRVPGILLEDAKKKKGDNEDQVGRRIDDTQTAKPTGGHIEAAKSDAEESSSDKSTTIANKTVGAQVDSLLAKLPELASKEGVDELAIDFCFVNSKASRNRLVKTVQDVPRGRSDLLPLYSRLVTTLGKYMPDILQNLISHLDEEFRSLQRRKQKDSLSGVRTSNIRYLAELTKFGVVPEHVIFHCLKVSLDDFSKMNIEVLCNLLENCGRYLLRNPETSPRMRSFLETLQRKKSAQHIGQQERMLIENAAYYVDPPERAAIQQRERTPMDLYVRKLVYADLSKRNVEKIVKQIRKLHWEEDDVVAILHKIFVKPVRIRYSNIHFLAIMLGSLNRYHPDFVISIIDDVLENITLGLEVNDFKYNQRRLADVRYLGELYVYRMIDSAIIFDTLFKVLTFGHNGWPRPDNICPVDLPDDFFRIRLVCSLLDTCGPFFDKGTARKKLDFFLTFFQYYIQIKDPAPMEIDFVVTDAYTLVRPQWKLAKTLEEAGSTFAEACKANFKVDIMNKPAEPEEVEADNLEDDGARSPAGEEEDSSTDEADEDADADADDQPTTPNGVHSDEEEHIIVTRPEDQRDPEAEAEFDRELAKMMSESMETRKPERPRQNFDIALPMRRGQQRDAANAGPVDDGETENVAPDTTKFSLLSKRGNKPQTRALNIPNTSSFAVALRTSQEASKAEQQRIKALVLNYDLRSEAEKSLPSTSSPLSTNNNTDGDPPLSYPPLSPNTNHSSRALLRNYTLKPVKAKLTETESADAGVAGAGSQGLYNGASSNQALQAGQGEAARGQTRTAGSGSGRRERQQGARKLQLADMDW